MGRTLPSIRVLIAEEIEGWKPMRETMRTPEDRKLFDDMLNLVYLHASEASMACSAIPFDYVAMGILFELYNKVVTGKFTHEAQGWRPMLEEFKPASGESDLELPAADSGCVPSCHYFD